jgi:hypothetical protein
MEASTPEGKLNQEWSQKRNGVKFQLVGILTLLNRIVFNRSEVIVADERTQILDICSRLDTIIFDYALENKKSKEQFLNAKNKRAKR